MIDVFKGAKTEELVHFCDEDELDNYITKGLSLIFVVSKSLLKILCNFSETSLLGSMDKEEEMIPLNSRPRDQEQGLPNLSFPHGKNLISGLQAAEI